MNTTNQYAILVAGMLKDVSLPALELFDKEFAVYEKAMLKILSIKTSQRDAEYYTAATFFQNRLAFLKEYPHNLILTDRPEAIRECADCFLRYFRSRTRHLHWEFNNAIVIFDAHDKTVEVLEDSEKFNLSYREFKTNIAPMLLEDASNFHRLTPYVDKARGINIIIGIRHSDHQRMIRFFPNSQFHRLSPNQLAELSEIMKIVG